jgi:succinyl-diaminopimelate desuccinylase
MVQALLAMAALRDSGLKRTHTIRLLVGSDEESTNKDFAEYLRKHRPPALSLVLDSDFPVVVGEKAWNAFEVESSAPYTVQAASGQMAYLVRLEAGLAASIVPSRAAATLETNIPAAAVALASQLQAIAPSEGYALEVSVAGSRVDVTARGRAAHSGSNIEGGRNALVFLARSLKGRLQRSGAADLLAFAGEAGEDLRGESLGLPGPSPLWGPYDVNVATIKPEPDGRLKLTINIRSTPGLTGPQLKDLLQKRLARFNEAHSAHLEMGEGYFDDTPLEFNPKAKLVLRLSEAYARAMGGKAPLAISGGGTYAKRVPNSIAFGMWFPGKPYPGHDTNENIPVSDLHAGVRVLLEALRDIAGHAPLQDPFAP